MPRRHRKISKSKSHVPIHFYSIPLIHSQLHTTSPPPVMCHTPQPHCRHAAPVHIDSTTHNFTSLPLTDELT
eukprot:5614727-Amphidinium_carterae.6